MFTTSMLKIRQNRAEVDIDANQGQGAKVHIGARAGGGVQGPKHLRICDLQALKGQ